MAFSDEMNNIEENNEVEEVTETDALTIKHINTMISNALFCLNSNFKSLPSVPFFCMGLPFIFIALLRIFLVLLIL